MTRKTSIQVRGAALIGLALALVHCRSDESGSVPAAPFPNKGQPALEAQPKSVQPKATVRAPVRSFSNFRIGASAYRTSLSVDGQVATLVTESDVTRFTPGGEPERRVIRMESEPAFTKRAIIFWQDGELRELPKSFGEVKVLGRVDHRPFQIVASEEHYAWLEKDGEGRFSIEILKNGKKKRLYQAEGALSTAAMNNESVFFVETLKERSFRIGAVSLRGEEPVFTKPKRGRSPSMLEAQSDGLYYFDLMGRQVLKLSADLEEERVLAKNTVCSPLAVSDKIYCARVEGIFALPLEGGSAEALTSAPLGLTARIAASSELLAWVSEGGREQSTLRLMWTSR